MKKTIRLNEADLRNMIMEAVNEIDRPNGNEDIANYVHGNYEYRNGGRWKLNDKDLAESQLHIIVKESINSVLNEGWFGNNPNYGEKWYNPFTWKSAKQKRQIDRRRAEIARSKAESEAEEEARERKEWERNNAIYRGSKKWNELMNQNKPINRTTSDIMRYGKSSSDMWKDNDDWKQPNRW